MGQSDQTPALRRISYEHEAAYAAYGVDYRRAYLHIIRPLAVASLGMTAKAQCLECET